MKRTYTSGYTKQECISFIKENVDFVSLQYGIEHVKGWTRFSLFSLSYRNGEIRRNNPIFNKAVGRIKTKQGKTIVSFRTYKGLTDIFSVLGLFASSVVIVTLASLSSSGIPLHFILLMALICTLLGASITWIWSSLSTEGIEGEQELIAYMERALKLGSADN
ncbi:hypothetical protein [Paenibacillus marinisediminis]